MLPREQFELLVKQFGSDRYYKTYFSWDQLITMLFGIFSHCDSMGEVCDGMRALGGKLNHLNMDCSPSKSTAGDALRERDNELFKQYYFALIKYFKPLLSVSRKEKVSFEKFYAFDSTTISLFSDVMKSVGRNRKDDGRKKGVFFVCRLKENAKAILQEVLFEKTLGKNEFGVYKEEHIHLHYMKDKKEQTLCLRLVYYKDEKGRKYKFITNNWDISCEEVALIYKYRWTIELTFKKLKQNFQLHFFYSDTENGIKTQVWCTLIAHLLFNVIQKINKSPSKLQLALF
jgi:hypothetical protein